MTSYNICIQTVPSYWTCWKERDACLSTSFGNTMSIKLNADEVKGGRFCNIANFR